MRLTGDLGDFFGCQNQIRVRKHVLNLRGISRADDRAGYSRVVQNIRLRARPVAEGLGDDLLRMSETVSRGGVDPIDSKFQGAMDRSDRVVVVLCAPAKLPAAFACRPSAKSEPGDTQI